MDPFKQLRSQLEQRIVRAWETLTEGWQEVLSRSTNALTYFAMPDKNEDERASHQDFPHWSVLAAETWETAQTVIIRVEIPGMNKDDLDISIEGNLVRIRGEKRSEGEHQGRRYHLMERAYGRFERTLSLPHGTDQERAEVFYKDGVLTVILPKTEEMPPRQLNLS